VFDFKAPSQGSHKPWRFWPTGADPRKQSEAEALQREGSLFKASSKPLPNSSSKEDDPTGSSIPDAERDSESAEFKGDFYHTYTHTHTADVNGRSISQEQKTKHRGQREENSKGEVDPRGSLPTADNSDDDIPF
jgi:hypothetical protein